MCSLAGHIIIHMLNINNIPVGLEMLLICWDVTRSRHHLHLRLDNLLAFMHTFTHHLSVAGWLRGASPCIRCRNVKNTHDRMAHKGRLAWDRERLYSMLIMPFSSQSLDSPPYWCSAERNECLEYKEMLYSVFLFFPLHLIVLLSIHFLCFSHFLNLFPSIHFWELRGMLLRMR